ncbi:FecR family protein [Prolixibacteraceae bacterium Z1-6]|uniref:FecR family protein n=1 Tax=Draconibacterium aestuarii TaxID=2998507 RepID=A0A9X3J7S0_9BACT|nr:FecR family protein [Prolixibacteraceae bacterium Z1-6]
MRKLTSMSFFEQHNLDSLIRDQKFFEWVLRPTEELNEYWTNYIHENPSIHSQINEARLFINGLVKIEEDLSEEEVESLWSTIDGTLFSQKRKIFSLPRWVAAASIVFVLAISGVLIHQYLIQHVAEIDYSQVVRLNPSDNEITLFLSDSTKESFSSDEVDISYNENGVLLNGIGKVHSSDKIEKYEDSEELNQLVVPFGKHSNITLSDGTKIWLNSGSRAIYPVVFTKKYREIYIEGEAYLEVAHNAGQPFYVKTDEVKVKVLGTKFNICDYPNDRFSSIVLVEGKVQASVGKEEVILTPNQLLSLEKLSGDVSLENANVLEYISWKDGWLYCNKEKLENIIVKLSRVYNIEFKIEDQEINTLTLSGKLDLKADCAEVMKSIALTAPIKYEIDNGVIKLEMK